MSDIKVIKEITDRINHISMTLAWQPRNDSEKESYETSINNLVHNKVLPDFIFELL